MSRPPLSPGSIRLDGKVALVTGAARGIGAACALALARFGADVSLADREADGLDAVAGEIEALGRRAATATIDVRERAAVRAWVDDSTARLGGLDVVVNNAAGTFSADAMGLSDRAEDSLVAENFTTVTAVTRAAVAHLRPHGSIINVTSVEAHRAAPGFAVYAAMKAAVANLTRSLALELAPQRIRVNAVAPDVIPTPGVGMLTEARAGVEGRGDALHPWPEPGDADDVAAAVVWLASPMAGFVTGSTIHVDGGTWAAGGWRRQLDDDRYRL